MLKTSDSTAVVLISITGEPKRVAQPLNCDACGKSCLETLKEKDTGESEDPCAFSRLRIWALLSARQWKPPATYNVDNRIMYTIGVTARKLKLLNADLIIGIALSVTGKNVYFIGR